MKHQRLIEALTSSYWMIQEEKLALIFDIVTNKEKYVALRAEAEEPEEAKSLKKFASDLPYVVSRGPVSYMELHGVMMKRMNMLDAISGGVSTENFGSSLDKLLEDDEVKTIVIGINSPGGSVIGTPELGSKIAAGSKKKKIIAVADGTAASAAYWIGSQATEFYGIPSSQVGSIGVILGHVNAKARQEDLGFKVEYLRVPDAKARPADNEDIDAKTREHLMNTLTQLHEDFVSAVAEGRNIDRDTVKEQFGQGRMVLAKNALEVGMIDGIIEVNTVLRQSKEKILMEEKEKNELAELRSQMADRDKQIAELTGKLVSEQANSEAIQQKLQAQQEQMALERIRLEIAGYKNLELDESHVKLLYSLEKSDPDQATTLRKTFADSNARVSVNLEPKGSDTESKPVQESAASVGAADELDARAAKMVEQGTQKTLADAAAFILANDSDLAARVAANVNPMMLGEAEEF